MSNRNRMIVACTAGLVLAAGFLPYGIRVVSSAPPADDQPYLTASHARAAQAKFSEARAAMEKALLLRDTAPASHVGVLQAAMRDMADELKSVEERAAASGSAESVRQAQARARDWYESGLKIINPPPGGLTELPLPMIVATKSHAAAAAMDELVQKTTTHALVTAPQPKYAGAEHAE